MRHQLPTLLALFLLGVLACGPRGVPSDLGPPPSILLLVVDCLRYDRLSAHGYPRPTTPNLDTLVREGVTFSRAWSQASWTRPSLPTILTGLYPSEHGVQAFLDDGSGNVGSSALPDAVTTLAEALGAAGYGTAMIGEQHQLSPRFGLSQGFDFFKNRAGSAGNIHTLLWNWLDSRPSAPADARFFAYLHYLEIHWPYCPPQDIRGTFDDGRSEILWCVQWRELRDRILSGELELGDDDRDALAARYDEELLGLDRQIGVLFQELRRRGLWDDTLIVLTADHGEEFFEHGGMGHSHSLYQELLDVPLVIKPPASWRLEVPRRSDAVVENRDLAATLLAAAGLEPPAGVSASSLLPWVFDPARTPGPQDYAVAEASDEVAVRAGDWKLIAARDGSAFELYDLAADPLESRNLAADHRAELVRMRQHLKDWHDRLLPAPEVEIKDIDPETAEGLRALGYIN